MLRSIVFPLYFLLVSTQLSTQSSPTSARNEQFKSPVILNVERPLVCTTIGESVKISCTLTRIDGVKFKNDWEISWFSDGRKLNYENVTAKNDSVFISYLTLDVTWSNERIFTCVGRTLEKTTNITVLNSSLIVRLKPPAIANIIGLRFIEKALGKTIQVFWKPVNYLNSTKYTLKYCVDDTEEILGTTACPHYRSFAGNCLLRHRDYYKVPNTTGFICKAEFKQRAGIYTVHKLYVATKVAGCEGVSAERRFHLSFWKDPIPDPDITELVMVPYPITNLKVLATKQRIVELSWSDPRFVHGENSREYTVGFKCLRSRNWSRRQHSGITNVTLTSRDIRHYHPYDLCRFCVTAKAYDVGSEPVCVDIRLHEEVPTGVPTVTCVGDECKTTSDGTKRNVTLTWALPAEEERNGVLTKVKIFLRDDRVARSVDMAVTNRSKSETVLTGLATNRSYVIQMVVCNKEGCGGLGNATKISALSDGAFSGGYSGGSIGDNLLVKLVSSIGGPLFVLLAVYFAYVTWTWLQIRKDHKASLQPDIFEPISYESVKEPDEDMAEYVVLDWKDQKQQKDSADLWVFYKEDREYKSDQQQCV